MVSLVTMFVRMLRCLSRLDLDMSCDLLEYTGVCSMGVSECKSKVKKSDRMMSELCCCLFVCLLCF